MTEDERFMQRAIRLATNGRGRVEPNPMVGCVIVKDGRIIGEGYHQQFGGPHAEPNALAACTESPEGATAYVTLEPCCHTSKKTPPCVPRLIEAKLGRVVIGATDPNPQVNGQGIAQLREAGISIACGVLERECQQLLALFTTQTVEKRPYVTLKWAQTIDGRVAGPGGNRLQITNSFSRDLVHTLRSRCDSILVGINTVLVDDPVLNARYASVPRHPTRFVLDRDIRTPLDARIVTDQSASTHVLHGLQTDTAWRKRRDALERIGVRLTLVPVDSDRRLRLDIALKRILDALCRDLLVEPGPTLAAAFLRDNLADRLWVFRSPKAINDPTAPAAAPIPDHFIPTGTLDLDGDTLTEYLNSNGPVFFAPVPSADFVLARDSV